MAFSDRPPPVLLSATELIRHRDERKTLTFSLVNGATVTGVVRWFDETAYHIGTADGSELTLLKHAVLYYKAT
jgi:sRNA-binding regulator protein Hfq